MRAVSVHQRAAGHRKYDVMHAEHEQVNKWVKKDTYGTLNKNKQMGKN